MNDASQKQYQELKIGLRNRQLILLVILVARIRMMMLSGITMLKMA
jgi:hypothetical protein